MLKYWKPLPFTTKFSAVAFIVTLTLGLLSMGALGAIVYYPVAFLFSNYPALNNWRGDWVWPTTIAAGMAWAFGFILASIAWHYLSKIIKQIMLLRLIYVIILWLWAAIVWYSMIINNLEPIIRY